jgi:hypothetical protein
VLYGKASGYSDLYLSSLTSTDGFKILPENVMGYLGYSVGGAGDFNQDGFCDLVLAAPGVGYAREHLHPFCLCLSVSPCLSSSALIVC